MKRREGVEGVRYFKGQDEEERRSSRSKLLKRTR